MKVTKMITKRCKGCIRLLARANLESHYTFLRRTI